MSTNARVGKPSVVLVVDDHPLIRFALREVLRLAKDAVELLEASSPEEGLAVLAARGDINLMVIEPKFSLRDGVAIVSQFHRAAPCVPLVIYTMCEDVPTLELAFAQGAAGVIPKTHSAILLQRAIEIVMEGGMYLPPALALRLARTEPAAPAPRAVSAQQSRILELLAQGLPNKAIARKLGIACSTVRNQLTLAFKRLGVANRTQAVIVTRALAKSSREITP
jgi:DNA-binding NarL/FixJ family response regulator